MSLDISIMKHEDEAVTIAVLRGSLDTETYARFTKNMLDTVKGPGTLIVDMERLTYISSMGISSLAEVRRTLEERGAAMVMAKVPEHISQVFKIVNALPNVKVFEDMAEVDRYLMEIQRRLREG